MSTEQEKGFDFDEAERLLIECFALNVERVRSEYSTMDSKTQASIAIAKLTSAAIDLKRFKAEQDTGAGKGRAPRLRTVDKKS